MLFFDIDADGFPKGAQFYFNLIITTIMIPINSTYLPLDIIDYWYLGGITGSRPFAIHIYRDGQQKTSQFIETYPHCVLEIDPSGEICWYDMVDYDTKDPWDVTPIIEDFDHDFDE